MRFETWVNKRVGLGLLLSVLLCVVGAALGALLESKELLQESQEGVWMCGLRRLPLFSAKYGEEAGSHRRAGRAAVSCSVVRSAGRRNRYAI